jgi:aminoglycoside phosphotransferase (APT) family kinase protein
VSESQIIELAARHGLTVDADSVSTNDAGLDYRVAFVRATDGDDWVLRIPRRPDVVEKLDEERRILAFIAPRLSVAVPRWEICDEELIAYRRLPGSPALTLDGSGQPIWHIEPQSPDFAAALGRLIAELQSVDVEAARGAGVPTLSAADVRARWRADLGRVREAFEIADPLLERWNAWLANDALWPDSTAFSHGELYAAHTLIEEPRRIVGVLDWTTAKVGDPAVDFSIQHMLGPAAFDATVAAYLEAGGVEHRELGARCEALAAAAPLTYALFALRTGDPEHRASAMAQLGQPAPE